MGTASALLLSSLVASPALAAPNGSQTGTGTNHETLTPTLTVSPGYEVNPDGDTVLTLEGDGYATQNQWGSNFGGAYLLFGVVTPRNAGDPGSWAPTKQGVSGTNYDYAAGAGVYQSLINYPGNGTEPGLGFMDQNGDWTSTLTIPGARFESQAGNQIDCLVQQCGVITIGAHGSQSAGVEVFTPVTFAAENWEAIAPTFSTQPADQTVELGGDATFTAEAAGDPAPSYQWQSRLGQGAAFEDIAGATSSSLTVPNAQLADNGREYRVLATNEASQVPSGTAKLTVVVSDPENETTTAVTAQASGDFPADFAGEDVVVTATVTPAAAEGTVEFFAGETSLGTAPATEGTATLTTTGFTGGAHRVTAVFTPSNPVVYGSSESSAVTYRIVDLARVVDDIAVTAPVRTISGAEFSWSVANYYSSVGYEFGKQALSGDVTIEDPVEGDKEYNSNRTFDFTGGTGTQDAAGNTVVEYTGEVRLTSGSASQWNFADPAVHVNAAGEGYVTAEFSGYFKLEGLAEYDYEPRRVTVATFTGAEPATDGAITSFTVAPIWEGQAAAGTWAGEFTGSFPNEFTSLLYSGIRSFFFQTGTSGANLTKPVQPISVSYEVEAAQPTETTTTLAAQATGAYPTDFAGEDVALAATVAPAAPGSVEFFAGATSLGAAVVTEGAAALTTDALAGGAHQVKAVFTPEDPAAHAASESAERTYRIVDLEPVVPAITLGKHTKTVSDAELRWSVANWVSFNAGPGKEVVDGNVALAALPETPTVEDRANRDFVFSDGSGFVDAAGNSAIEFEGTIRLTSGSLPRWTISDPRVHTTAAGDGYITAEVKTEYFGSLVGGEDEEFSPGRIVVATFLGGTASVNGKSVSFDATPVFEGQVAAGTWAGAFTGATLTNQFLQYVNSGVRAFLYQSGTTGSNLTKPGRPIGVSYATSDITKPVDPEPVDPEPVDPKPLPFTDVSKGAKFYTEIDWMFQNGLTTGVKQSDGSVAYQPKAGVSREAMAAFLYRLEGSPRFSAPKTSPFSDLKPSDKFYKEITWLASKGITTGVKQASGKPKFLPKEKISREAMAAFMYRFAGSPKHTVPRASAFADLAKGDKFYAEIHWMKTAGITTGVQQPSGKPAFQPKSSVTREAMAAFIYRLKR
ncbi:Ig-like domain repeat protein [Leucobacter sp.]